MPAHRGARNVLFIMCDQLRWDHLSCYGNPVLETPHIDALARRGVRFDNAFVQSAVCVPSRMSFYTGRYVSSHGTTWNHVPFPVSQVTLGDHLRKAGRQAALAGKTHVVPDLDGLRRNRHIAGRWLPAVSAADRDRGYRQWSRAAALSYHGTGDTGG